MITFKKFLEESDPENSSRSEKFLDWVVYSILVKKAIFGGENQTFFDERLKAYNGSETTPYKFFKENDDGRMFTSEECDIISGIKISGDRVSCASFVLRNFDESGPPPFKFEKVDRAFVILESKNLQKVEQWFPKECGFLKISHCPNFDISGIEKQINTCEEIGVIGEPLKGSILGLVTIKNLNYARFDVYTNGNYDSDRSELLQEIIIRHLPASKTYEGGDQFDFQTELFENDFDEFTKL